MRTDFTSEIDGALAARNLGSRHFSDIARSGNGNMLSDLSEDQLADYEELDGLGEAFEELSGEESASLDLGKLRFPKFRAPKFGEVPPFAAKPGRRWYRKLSPTDMRKPGGKRVARAKWVQMTPDKFAKLAVEGGPVAGLGLLPGGTAGMIGFGALAGLAAWFLIRKRG